ncbi:phosphatidylinositol 3-kinase catalytic subunit type 3-like isoform X2 [Mya arenaria]|nr:phosphatidylinositol 3-kinase catalytic subunit type 3-like isoform X2 [Mya arenaria]
MLRYSGAYCPDCSDLYVTCRVFSGGNPISLISHTAYKAFSTRWNWNEWLRLPIKYSDLPRDSVLALTVWDIYGTDRVIPVGGTTITLFGKKGTFRQGMHDLKVWPDVEADPRPQTTTPGKPRDSHDQMSRLSKLSKRHRDGHMVKIDWLDRLTFREIEMVNERQKRDSNHMYLMIEFPRVFYENIDYTIVYFEKGGDDGNTFNTYGDLVVIPDPEISLENLVESKHHRLARSLRSGPTDRDMKPDAKIRNLLNTIVGYPPTKTLTSEEEDLVWKYRFYLSSQKKALTKFLKCVKWSQAGEVKQALELLGSWSPMDVEDALELLTPTFSHPAVRKYAVNRLRQADDDDLLLYLLQLVQALKYENFDEIQAAAADTSTATTRRESISQDDNSPQQADKDRYSAPVMTRTTSHDSLMDELGTSPKQEESTATRLENEMDLATFLISRASHNLSLANYFYWYLMVESEDHEMEKDQRTKDMYYTVFKRFSSKLVKGGQEFRHRRAMLIRQQNFMDRLVNLVKIIARESGNRKKKIEKLQALLQDPDVCKINFSDFETLPLPLDPDIKVNAIEPTSATLFKSNLMPCRLTFRTNEGGQYVTLFKHGDDLRQDQLILQMFTLMDRLLKKENLDLKLTPYKTLATSTKHGFVQFIESQPVADVLEKEGTIQNYFRKLAPSEGSTYGIVPEVMDNYIKSCASYCVVTYLLGVGDRHLDNLMLCSSGKLFHIDFGYILGRDPKPLPPPMKLSKEMVDAMGGTTSDHFKDFKLHCFTAFLALRRSANLILNLFSLMVDANIPDIALEPDKTVKKVQDKFVLHLTDEEAVAYLQSLIDESVSALMPALVEQFHKMAQYWRR